MNKEIKYYNLKSPLTVQVELTPRCTNKCIYCYNAWRYDNEFEEDELSLIDFTKVLEEIINSDVFEIVFTGGEPLLRRDLLYRGIEIVTKKDIVTKINTNLVLFNDRDMRKIKDLSIGGVLTSISSYDKRKHNRICGTNSFDKVIQNLESLILQNIPTAVNMVVVKDNKDDVYETGKFLHEKVGLEIFCATPISPCSVVHKDLEIKSLDIERILEDLSSLERDFNMYVDVLEPIPFCIISNPEKYISLIGRDCSAGRSTVTVSPSGDVRPCTHVSKKYGNLLNESMEKIWKNMEEWRSGLFVPNKCNDCGSILSCSLGCREASNIYFGDYKAEDPLTIGYGPLDKFSINNRREIFNEQDVFNMVLDLRYREENGNYIIFSPTTYTMAIVNKPFFLLISNLNSLKAFSIKQIIGSEHKKDINEVCELFNFLLEKRFIKKVS